MKKLIKYQTRDKQLFNTRRDANSHLENKYKLEIDRHAHRLANIVKHQDISKYLEENLESFEEILKFKRDREVEED